MNDLKIHLQLSAEITALKKILITTPELKIEFDKERDRILEELKREVEDITNRANKQ